MRPRRLTAAVLSLLTAMAIVTPITEASQKNQKVEAQYRDIKILYNSNPVSAPTEPFIIAGTTYIPLSMMAGVFNKTVNWDGNTKTIRVSDNTNAQVEQLRTELTAKNNKITELTAELNSKDTRIADLEKQLRDARENEEEDLEDIEENLNDDYGDWNDMDLSITLDGDEEDIEVEIEVDLDDYEEEWSDLSNSEIENLVEDILDDIWNEYDDAVIEGSIIDSAEDDELVDFSGEDGEVEVDVNDSNMSLSDLEDELRDSYEDYFDDISLSITLNGSEEDVQFIINVAYEQYEDEWDDLSDSEIDRLMDNVRDDIADEFGDADIDGYVYDTDNDVRLVEYDE